MSMLKFRTNKKLDVMSPGGIFAETFHIDEIVYGDIRLSHDGMIDVELKDGRILLDVPDEELDYDRTICIPAL